MTTLFNLGPILTAFIAMFGGGWVLGIGVGKWINRWGNRRKENKRLDAEWRERTVWTTGNTVVTKMPGLTVTRPVKSPDEPRGRKYWLASRTDPITGERIDMYMQDGRVMEYRNGQHVRDMARFADPMRAYPGVRE